MQILSLSGSPSTPSRSAWMLHFAQQHLDPQAQRSRHVALRDLPPQALVTADTRDPAVSAALSAVAEAEVLIVATPIYKAAYSGLLKVFLDLLPQDGLRGKTVLPLATGGSLAHLLALDYALKPVLSALGARDILDGVFATDAQLVSDGKGNYTADAALATRLERALAPLQTRAQTRAQVPEAARADLRSLTPPAVILAPPEGLRCPA